MITGTGQGDATDINGKYSISDLDPGSYSITVTYISYQKKTITGVGVKAGEVTTLNITLSPETVGLDEVTVVANADMSSEAGLLSIRKKSTAVQDGISSELMSKNNDSNVATAMKRVAGVTLIGENSIYIRGLGNRYSNVQLNGSQVPSTDPNKKEAPVDIISSGVVDNIVVQKTYTPDQEGEFSGGSVQITTKEFPESKNLTFSYSTSYNTLYTFDERLGYSGGKTDFLGFDDGMRKLPEEVKDGNIGSIQEAAAISRTLHNEFTPASNNVIPNQKFALSYANQFNEEQLPIGVVSNFSYKYGQSARPNESFRDIQNLLRWSDFTIDTGEEQAQISGLLNIFIKPNNRTKIGFKNLYSNSAKDKSSVIQGTIRNQDNIIRQTVLEFDRRSIFTSSVNYETYFPQLMESDLKIDLSFSRAQRDIPDRRNTQYAGDPSEGIPFEVTLADKSNLHFFSDQVDRNYTGRVDYHFKPVADLTVKAGGQALVKRRDFQARRLLYQDLDNSLNLAQKQLSPENLFIPEFIETGSLEFVENTRRTDSYEGEQDLYAAYLSANWFITNAFSIEAGLRAENSEQRINGETIIDKTDLLPALNATYRLTDNINIRGAASLTLARPEFREISRFQFRDFFGGRTIFGNPDLDRTKIYNADLRFEWYPNSGELLAVSGFYKHFQNPIELFFRVTQNNEVFYGNAPEADLLGGEIELRKNITDRLKLNTTFAYIHSRVQFDEQEVLGRLANSERPMFGQSPFTLNVSAFYLVPRIDLEVNASYNTFGERISAVGNAQQPGDEYEQPFHKVDFNVVKDFGRAKVRMGVENLLNDEVQFMRGDLITNEYPVGMTFNMGISYSF